MAAYRRVYDSHHHITCRLTEKNRDQLRNPTHGNRVWASFTFFCKFRGSEQAKHSKRFRTLSRPVSFRKLVIRLRVVNPGCEKFYNPALDFKKKQEMQAFVVVIRPIIIIIIIIKTGVLVQSSVNALSLPNIVISRSTLISSSQIAT